MSRPQSHKSVPAALMHERETSRNLIAAQKKLIDNLTAQVEIYKEKADITEKYITLLQAQLKVKEDTILALGGPRLPE